MDKILQLLHVVVCVYNITRCVNAGPPCNTSVVNACTNSSSSYVSDVLIDTEHMHAATSCKCVITSQTVNAKLLLHPYWSSTNDTQTIEILNDIRNFTLTKGAGSAEILIENQAELYIKTNGIGGFCINISTTSNLIEVSCFQPTESTTALPQTAESTTTTTTTYSTSSTTSTITPTIIFSSSTITTTSTTTTTTSTTLTTNTTNTKQTAAAARTTTTKDPTETPAYGTVTIRPELETSTAGTTRSITIANTVRIPYPSTENSDYITGPVAGAVCGVVVLTTAIIVIVYCKRKKRFHKTSRKTDRIPKKSDQLEADEPYFDMTENPMYDRTDPQTCVLHESENVNQLYQEGDTTSGTANENANFANFERLRENTCENNSRAQTEGFPMYSTVKPMRKL